MGCQLPRMNFVGRVMLDNVMQASVEGVPMKRKSPLPTKARKKATPPKRQFVQIEVTPQQMKLFRAVAKDNGLTVAGWARSKLMGQLMAEASKKVTVAKVQAVLQHPDLQSVDEALSITAGKHPTIPALTSPAPEYETTGDDVVDAIINEDFM